MEAMGQTWTDDRMDELARQVDSGFSQMRVDMGAMRNELHREVKQLRSETQAQAEELRREMQNQGQELRSEIAGLRQEMHTALGETTAIVAAGQRTMLQICGGFGAAAIAALAAIVAATL